jgi:CHASE2 domain-containing sensor protein
MKTTVICLFAACLLWPATTRADAAQDEFEQAFVFTFIDRQFEHDSGGPPFDRSLYAKAIDRCRELGAKGVVIKLFLDQARPGDGDDLLAQAMRKIPVVLQARLEPQTGLPVELDHRFAFEAGHLVTSISAGRGWMPLAALAAAAADVGFVDFADDQVPLLETYREKTYKSVIVCALELQSGKRSRATPRGELLIGKQALPVDRTYVQTVVRSEAMLPTCSFADLLTGKISPERIKGRVVILGYTGRDAPTIRTVSGELEAHVFFGQCLRAVFESIRTRPK